MLKRYVKVLSLISEIKQSANQYIVCRMQSMGIKGLVTSHGNILGHLYLHGPTRMAEIAKQINRKKNTVTTLVYKLEQQGYVKITTDENDLRARIVSLTPKAEEIRDDFFAISIGLVEKTFMGIAEDEREQVLSCLTKMRDNLE